MSDLDQAAVSAARTGAQGEDRALSYPEMRHWLLSQLQPDNPAYYNPIALRLQGDLDQRALQAALDDLVKRHESLRTVFPTVGGTPVREVLEAGPVPIEFEDLTGAADDDVARRVAELAHARFQLDTGPLFRVHLVRVSPDDHVLLLASHHVIADGWSVGVVLGDLAVLYEHHATGRTGLPSLTEPTLRYRDFAREQTSDVDDPGTAADLEYWRGRLADVPMLELPTDGPRRAAGTQGGGTLFFDIPPHLYKAVTEFARASRATPFITFLAAFEVLLSKLSGQPDVTVGSPVAGRPRADLQDLVGCFVNMVVFRGDLSGDPSFRELLRRTRTVAVEAYAHQELPFEKLVFELQPQRDATRYPFFQAILTMQPSVLQVPSLHGLEVSNYAFEHGMTIVDLTVTIEVADSAARGMISYDRGLFRTDTVERLVDRFLAVLEAMAADPDAPLSSLDLLTSDERASLPAWEGPAATYEVDSCIHELVAERAAETPDAVALVDGEAVVTYAELDQRANRLAHHLRASGAGPEARVGMLLPRSADAVVAMLAIMKAGGAYLPLDPENPGPRLRFMLDDAGAELVVTDRANAAVLGDTGAGAARLVLLDADAPGIDAQPSVAPRAGVTADNAAYVIYTSGSTGTPKGVVVTHRTFAQLLAGTESYFGLGPQHTWTLFHSLAFDFSVWETWGALCSGGRLVVVPPAVARVPSDFLSLLVDQRVTFVNQTPSAFAALARELRKAGEETAQRLCLRWVGFCGEVLRAHHLDDWRAIAGRAPIELVNMYGITETTVLSTVHRLGDDPEDATELDPPIGRPMAHTGIRILDEHLRPVPVGVVGEIHVAGPVCARGYLGRAALTAERFVPDAHSRVPGTRLYRSGDMGRWRPDGTVECLGRRDHQVKMRGFRIELGEIEAAIVAHPSVREAVASVLEDRGYPRLVAYVVPLSAGGLPTTDVLRDHLRDRLPPYMVPHAYVVLDALPLNASGKVDRLALPVPASTPEEAAPAQAPRDPVEEVLASIWAEVLGVERVDVTDDFFGLGGNSILSIRVVALAEERGIVVPPGSVFSAPTLEQLAAVVRTAAEGVGPAGPPAPFALVSPSVRSKLPGDVEDAYPPATIQAGMLFHSSFEPGSGTYHDVFGYRVNAPWDEDALRDTLRRMTARHPVLRTTFDVHRFGTPLQLVHRVARPPITVFDGRARPPRRSAKAYERFVEQERRTDFDWTQEPPLRVFVHRVTDEAFDLTLSMHHALLDGWSVALFCTEFSRLYSAALQGVGGTEEKLRSSYARFVELERAVDPTEATAFWSRHLEGARPSRVVGTASARSGPSTTAHVSVELGREQTARLRALARSLHVPVKSIFLAAHAVIVAAQTGEETVVAGVVAHGRPEEPDGDRLLGVFLNTLPLRIDVADASWEDVIVEAYKAERASYPYRRYPLADILHARDGELFDWTFNYTHFHVLQEAEAQDGVVLEPIGGAAATNFPLLTDVVMEADTASVVLTHDLSAVDARRAHFLLEGFRSCLEALLDASTGRARWAAKPVDLTPGPGGPRRGSGRRFGR